MDVDFERASSSRSQSQSDQELRARTFDLFPSDISPLPINQVDHDDNNTDSPFTASPVVQDVELAPVQTTYNRFSFMQRAQSPTQPQVQEVEHQETSPEQVLNQENHALTHEISSNDLNRRPRLNDVEIMEFTQNYSSIIDVYRPHIDRICNTQNIEKRAKRLKINIDDQKEEFFADSYSLASIIEQEIKKHQRKTKKADDSDDPNRNQKTDDEKEDANKIWIEKKLLSFHSLKFHVKVHGRLITTYTQRSFSRFSMFSFVRQLAIWINEWDWFERIILAVILINAALFGAQDWQNDAGIMNKIQYYWKFFIAIFFLSEMMIKMIAMGLLNDKNTYLKDFWNVFDLFIVIASIFSLYSQFFNLTVLRTLRLYKTFYLQTKFQSMSNLMTIIMKTIPLLVHLSALLFVCQIFYSIIGLQMFSGQQNNRCRQTLMPVNGDWLVVPGDTQVCGGQHQCNAQLNQTCGSLFNSTIRGMLTNLTDEDLYRDSNITEFNYGLTNFNNMFKSFVTVFQLSTQEGWMQIMQISIDGDNQIIASTYFITLLIFIHYLIINLTLGVMVVNSQQLQIKKEEDQALSDQLEDLNRKYLQKQAQLQITNTDNDKRTFTFYLGQALMMLCAFKPEPEPMEPRYDYQFFRMMWQIVQYPLFKLFFLLLTLFNLVMISIKTRNVIFEDHFPQFQIAYFNLTMLCTNMLFVIELIIRCFAYSKQKLFSDFALYTDLATLILFFSFFATDCIINKKFVVQQELMVWTNRFIMFNFLRTFRIIQSLRKVTLFGHLIQTLICSLKEIGNYLIALFIFIYVCAIVGLELFSKTQIQGFFNLPNAMLQVFFVLLGERWNLIFYECYLATNALSAILYFFTLVIFGSVVMMNFFLVILLNNYHRQSLLIQVEEARQKLIKIGGESLLSAEGQTFNPVIINEQNLNQIYGYGEGIPQKLYLEDSPVKSILKIARDNDDQPLSSQRAMLKQESFLAQNKEKKNPQYDSSLEMEDYVQRYQNFQEYEKQKIVQDIKKRQSETNVEQNQIPQALGILGLSQEQKMQIRQRATSDVADQTFMREIEPKLPTRRIEIVNGRLQISKEATQVSKIFFRANKNNRVSPVEDSNKKERGPYQKLFDDFSCQALYKFFGECSLFILHKNSDFRKFLIRVVIGGESERTFLTIQELIDFYSQNVEELKMQKQLNGKKEHNENSEKEIDIKFDYKDSDNVRSSELDSSQVIDELEHLSYDKNFSIKKLQDQAKMIAQIIEQKYPSFYNKGSKQRGLFYLDRKRDINIQWQKWYNFTIHSVFFFFTQMSVLLAIAVLIVYDPFADPKSQQIIVIRMIDLCLTIIFFFEAIIKIFALGFVKTSLRGRAYLQNAWNVLDFIILIITIVQIQKERNYLASLIFNQDNPSYNLPSISILRVLRVLRILRPLRQSNHFLVLKLIFNTIISIIPQMMCMGIICFLVLLVFGIIGTSLFKGVFYKCIIFKDQELALTDPMIMTKNDCLNLGHVWLNSKNNFDTVQKAIWTLILISTSTSSIWIETMHSAVNSAGLDMQPKLDRSRVKSLYFIAYQLTSKLLLLNMFLAIVYQKYSTYSDRMLNLNNANSQQRAWIDIQRQLMRLELQKKWYPPEDKCRKFASKLAKNQYFDGIIFVFIILNTVCLSIPFMGMSEEFSKILENIIFAFTVVFNLEAVVKITGLGKHYFFDRWNLFDLGIVVLSDLTYILDSFLQGSFLKIVIVLRALRAIRVFKVFNKIRSVIIFFNAITLILGTFMYILFLIFLNIIIFIVVGMDQFKGVILQQRHNQTFNFRNFQSAFLLLVNCLTGQNWGSYVNELSITNINSQDIRCIENQTFQDWQKDGILGCGSDNSYYFFFAFIIISRLLLINLIIGSIIFGFISANRESNAYIKPEDIQLFLLTWADYDPDATGWIDVKDIIFLLYELPAPLGKSDDYKEQQTKAFETLQVEKKLSSILSNEFRFFVNMEKNMVLPFKNIIHDLKNFNLHLYNNPTGNIKVHFKEVFIAFMSRALNKGVEPKDVDMSQFYKVTNLNFDVHFRVPPPNTEIKGITVGTYLAGTFIARIQRSLSRKQMRHGVKHTYQKDKKEQQLEVIQAIQQVTTQTDLLSKGDMPQKSVKFQSDLDIPSTLCRKSQLYERQDHKDINRSTWWLPIQQMNSTAKKIQNWISQQDYYFQQQKQSEKQQIKPTSFNEEEQWDEVYIEEIQDTQKESQKENEDDDFKIKQNTLAKAKILLNNPNLVQIQGSNSNSFQTDSSFSNY